MRRLVLATFLILAPALASAVDAPADRPGRDEAIAPDEASADADVTGPGTRAADRQAARDQAAPGNAGYAAPGAERYDAPGGNGYDAPGGPCYAGPGGPCYVAPGGVAANCPSYCR